MGIRYDRNQRRATNGPVIFFNDSVTNTTLSDQINDAVFTNLSFYAYRYPHDMLSTFGSSESIVEGIGQPGFVIAPFLPDSPYFTIPDNNSKRLPLASFRYSQPVESTTLAEYESEFNAIQQALSALSNSGKIVASKIVKIKGEINAGAAFINLCLLYPEAYVFCFGSPDLGCWIGASPELLLKSEGDGFETMALAGTRIIENRDSDWDCKNIEEQAMVSDFIKDTLENFGMDVIYGKTFTKKAGKIEHICTPIFGKPTGSFDAKEFEALLKHLSPTPALCGLPKDLALSIISRNEKFERGFYGGFCGPYISQQKFTFNVVLRCASFSQNDICLYAGGGITFQSNLNDEWQETERKLSTLKSALIFLKKD